MDGFAELCDPWARISERKPYVRLWKWEKGGAWTRKEHATVVAMLWTVCDSGGPDALKHMPFDSCAAVIRCWLFLRRAALSGLTGSKLSEIVTCSGCRDVSALLGLCPIASFPHLRPDWIIRWDCIMDCEHRFSRFIIFFFPNHDVI